MATGAVLILLGVFLVVRTVTHDDSGQNLVDKLLGLDGGAAPGEMGPVSSYFASRPRTAGGPELGAEDVADLIFGEQRRPRRRRRGQP
jgi:hypothetical protein